MAKRTAPRPAKRETPSEDLALAGSGFPIAIWCGLLDEFGPVTGVPPSGSGHSPKGGARKRSPAKPSVPNAVRTVLWRPKKGLHTLTRRFSRYRSVSVGLGRTKRSGRTWAVTFKGKGRERLLAIPAETMAAIIEAVRRIEYEERLLKAGWQPVSEAKWQASTLTASADRSGEAGETSTQIEGSTEGESAVPKADAQTPSPNLSRGDTP
jgi:hypothetical protein